MPLGTWGYVELTVIGDPRDAKFSHGNNKTGQYCLTYYPCDFCTCGCIRLIWIVPEITLGT